MSKPWPPPLAGRVDKPPTSPESSKKEKKSPLPEHLSFYVRIEFLGPNYKVQKIRHAEPDERYWLPPNEKDAFNPIEGGTFFRWMGGRLAPTGQIDRTNLTEFDATTVFTQRPSTAHLLAVPFDARKKSVCKTIHGWQPISFDHIKISDIGDGRSYYFSSITKLGSEGHICAPGPSHWVPQLLDPQYDNSMPMNKRVHVGMIGDLPLLFAIAALSAPKTASLGAILQQCLQPGVWRPHGYPLTSAHRYTAERGVVVTVYLDPENPEHGSKKCLEKMQDGKYGPFYSAQQPAATTPSGARASANAAYPSYQNPGSQPPPTYGSGSTSQYSGSYTTSHHPPESSSRGSHRGRRPT